MEKPLLIQNLRSRVGEDVCKVISDKTCDGLAESVLSSFADDSKITEETWLLPVATLKQFAGQKRHDEKEFSEKFKTDYANEYKTQHEKDVEDRIKKAIEDAKKTAIDEYKKEHPEGGKTSDDDINAKVNTAVAEALKGLTGEDSDFSKALKTISGFVTTQKEREKTEQKNRVREDLKKHLVALRANEEACIDDALDDLDYGEDPKFDDLKQKAIDAYERRYKRYYGDGGKPFGGSGSGGGGEDNSFVKERINALKKEVQDNANYAKEVEETFQ